MRTRAENVAFVVAELKANPAATYSDIVKAGKSQDFHVYPLIMGLAKKELGLPSGRREKRTRKPVVKAKRPSVKLVQGTPKVKPVPKARGGIKLVLGDLAAGIEGMHNVLRQIAQLVKPYA